MGGTASKSGASTKTLLVAGNAKTSLVAESKIVTADLPIEGSTSHNYDDIIKSADTPLDQSSKEKLYDQLHSGVYLNKKRQAGLSKVFCVYLEDHLSIGLKRILGLIASCYCQGDLRSYGETTSNIGLGLHLRNQ
ncbi:hypothetical protein FRX31_031968, partial [Thalictrum thalictroides]